jgi:hypothetical protein
MNTFKNAIGAAVMISSMLAAGCTLESTVPEGEAAESVAGTSEGLAPSQFSGWSPIPSTNPNLHFAYGAAITSMDVNARFVFSVNADNSHMMSQYWFENTTYEWGGWYDLGGQFNSKPAAVGWHPPRDFTILDRIVIVGRGKNDNRYWFAGWQNGLMRGNWSPFPNGTFDSAPAAALLNDKVVVCGRAGPQIWCATNTIVSDELTTWTPWVKAVDGAFFDGDPGLASDVATGTLRLVGRKPSTGHYWFSSSTDGVNWQSFTEIPDAFFYSGAAVSARQGVFDYFGEGAGHLVWETSTTESNGFQPLPDAQVVGSPAAVARDNNHVDVVGLDSSGMLRINTWQQ